MALLNVAHAHGVPLHIRALAADAAVLCISERIRRETRIPNRPALEPQNYHRDFQNTNAIGPEGPICEHSAPPVIEPGPVFTVRRTAAAGHIVGILRIRGPLPCNSRSGRGVSDAFVIVSQPPGDPFTVSMGGVLRVATPAALRAGDLKLEIFGRTSEQRYCDDPAVEHCSGVETVTARVVEDQQTRQEAGSPPFQNPGTSGYARDNVMETCLLPMRML